MPQHCPNAPQAPRAGFGVTRIATLTITDRAAEDAAYIAYHATRFRYLLDLVQQLKPDRVTRVLDIGRSRLTAMLADVYDDVSTIGMAYETQPGFQGFRPPSDGRALAHRAFNFNDLRDGATLPDMAPFDLIVFAEVIEHLWTAPEMVLAALAGRLKQGGMVVCQTPNAAALHKRLILLAGRNPYERIRLAADDFGHSREYTRSELVGFAAAAGFDVVSHRYANYFGLTSPTPLRRLADTLLAGFSCLVPSLARGQTIVYRRAR